MSMLTVQARRRRAGSPAVWGGQIQALKISHEYMGLLPAGTVCSPTHPGAPTSTVLEI